ncbi:MAG: DUF1761 domain-containing protein [Actinomycetota bacterium]
MSFDVLGDLNWLAVIVATVAYFALGAIWYAPPVFGNLWMRSGGIQVPEQPQATFYIVPFITCLLATIALAMLAAATGSDTVGEGIVLGLVTGVGIAAAALLVSGFFDPQKPQAPVWVAVVAGYHLVGLLIAAIILSLWT